MKIVQVITELRSAGAERIVLELTKGLVKRGHEVHVISLLPTSYESNIVCELQKINIPIYSLRLKKYTLWRIFGLRKLLKKIAPDIVHSHLIHANLTARLNSFAKDYKLINTVHIAEKRRGKWWHFFADRLTFRLCDAMTVVSHAVQKFHSSKIGIKPEDLPVIYNGVDNITPLANKKINELKKEWGISHCTKIIGSVGRLNAQKGYDLLLSKLDELSRRVPESETWAIVIIGEGEERKNLQGYLCEKIKIVLPGFRSDAARCIAMFDLFCMPSRYEGFGLVLVEAMCHGVPILANSVDSLPELLENYTNGRVVDFTSRMVACDILQQINLPRTQPYNPFTLEKMIEDYLLQYKAGL